MISGGGPCNFHQLFWRSWNGELGMTLFYIVFELLTIHKLLAPTHILHPKSKMVYICLLQTGIGTSLATPAIPLITNLLDEPGEEYPNLSPVVEIQPVPRA